MTLVYFRGTGREEIELIDMGDDGILSLLETFKSSSYKERI